MRACVYYAKCTVENYVLDRGVYCRYVEITVSCQMHGVVIFVSLYLSHLHIIMRLSISQSGIYHRQQWLLGNGRVVKRLGAEDLPFCLC